MLKKIGWRHQECRWCKGCTPSAQCRLPGCICQSSLHTCVSPRGSPSHQDRAGSQWTSLHLEMERIQWCYWKTQLQPRGSISSHGFFHMKCSAQASDYASWASYINLINKQINKLGQIQKKVQVQMAWQYNIKYVHHLLPPLRNGGGFWRSPLFFWLESLILLFILQSATTTV